MRKEGFFRTITRSLFSHAFVRSFVLGFVTSDGNAIVEPCATST